MVIRSTSPWTLPSTSPLDSGLKQLTIILFVSLFKCLILRGPLELRVCLVLIGCCLVSSFVQNPLLFQRGGFVTFSFSEKWHFWDFLKDYLNFKIPATEVTTKVKKPTTNFKNVSFQSEKKWQTHCFETQVDSAQNLTQDHSQSEASVPSSPRVPSKSNLLRELWKVL